MGEKKENKKKSYLTKNIKTAARAGKYRMIRQGRKYGIHLSILLLR